MKGRVYSEDKPVRLGQDGVCEHGHVRKDCGFCLAAQNSENRRLAKSIRRDAKDVPETSCLLCGHIKQRAVWHEASGVYVCIECRDAVRELERLRSQLSAAERDTQRLDFISEPLHTPERNELDDSWSVYGDRHHGWHEAPTLREAIDKAMSPESPKMESPPK